MEVEVCTVGASSAEEVAEVNGIDAGERESRERESRERESRKRESGEIESREVAGAKGAKGAKGVAEAKEVEAGRIPSEITIWVLRSIAAAKFRYEPA